MPIYEYVCQSCEKKTEIIQRVGERPLRLCPHCGGKVKKALSAPAIQFKGSGWYITDYARAKKEEKPTAGKGEPKTESAGKGEAKSESAGKGEAKTESAGKGEAKTESAGKGEPKTESAGKPSGTKKSEAKKASD